ncbi:MAG: actin-binding WH2 domain-containing protein [Armatimonadetes bacterium]|nr:actin-binding WH2 domain-containing protein [Armatimonadota bacterium]
MVDLGAPFRILQDRAGFFDEVKNVENLWQRNLSLLLSASLYFAIYGALMGGYSGWGQALSAAVKLPILYVLTAAICLPALYVLNLLFGAKQNLAQHVMVILGTLAITGVLLLGFAPITAFFLMTADHYQFFKLLNVSILAATALFGVTFFHRGMLALTDQDAGDKKARRRILILWIFLFAFVGSQLGWTVRPFFGAPDLPFEIIREVGGNFYVNVLEAIGEVFGFN